MAIYIKSPPPQLPQPPQLPDIDPLAIAGVFGSLPSGFFWTDADNIDVPMTTDELVALESAMQQNMVLQGFKIHERQRQMKEEVDRLTTLDDIRQYPPDWPPASTADAGK